MVLPSDMIYRNVENMKNIPYVFLTVSLLTACGFSEPTRVEKDFGVSVRNMVAAQIYDPEVAADPEVLGPETLAGPAAQASVEGQLSAAQQARVNRQRDPRSPLPVVGIASEN